MKAYSRPYDFHWATTEVVKQLPTSGFIWPAQLGPPVDRPGGYYDERPYEGVMNGGQPMNAAPVAYSGYGAVAPSAETVLPIDWPGIDSEAAADAIATNLIHIAAQLGSRVIGSIRVVEEEIGWRIEGEVTPFYFSEPREVVTDWADLYIHEDLLDGFADSLALLLAQNTAAQSGMIVNSWSMDVDSAVVERGAQNRERLRVVVHPPALTPEGAAVLRETKPEKKFPWVPVAIVGGGIGLLGTFIYVMRKK